MPHSPAQPTPRRRPTLLVAGMLVVSLTLAVTALVQAPSQVQAATATTTIVSSADAYVDSARPTSNFGGRTTLNADASPAQAILIRFDVPESQAQISRATALVYVTGSSRDGLALAESDGGWTESAVTWANAPTSGVALDSQPTVSKGAWASFDVTSAVNGGAGLSVRIETPGTRKVPVASREAGSATAPRLIIETGSSPGPDPSPSDTTSPTTAPTTTSTAPPPASSPPADGQPALPIRAAFYYPWFPEAWSQSGIDPFTWYEPTAGYYDGRDPAVATRHVQDMLYAGLDAGIASWWGQGSKEDARIPMLLSAAADTPFRWTLYYEPEAADDPSPEQISSDLAHIGSTFGTDPSYLRIDGKPVIFVYAGRSDGCAMADRWARGNTEGFYVVLKVFSGYSGCTQQPQGWHQYGPASSFSSHLPYSSSVSPGFWLRTEDAPRLARDETRFEADVAAMVASQARFQLVTTYNEWGEGTSVESATAWSGTSSRGAYLDILRKHLVGQGVPSTSPTTTVSSTPSSPTTTPTSTASAPPPGPGDPVIAAVGDIACDPTSSSFREGLGTTTSCRQLAVSDLVLDIPNVSAVLPLGDIQYEDGSLEKFRASYDLSWGRYLSMTRPVPGNHEYLTSGASGYYSYFGARAGDPAKGYYSYDLGDWHLVALNSNCSKVGGCGTGSPQLTWLKADLAASPARCTLAYWHHPTFSSGHHGNNPGTAPLWDALVDAGAEVVLSGHDHAYERFAPQTSDGAANPTNGMRQFVVGTGGKNHYALSPLQPNSEASDAATFGLLTMTLRPDGYDWRFVPEPGSTFTDTGSASCH